MSAQSGQQILNLTLEILDTISDLGGGGFVVCFVCVCVFCFYLVGWLFFKANYWHQIAWPGNYVQIPCGGRLLK